VWAGRLVTAGASKARRLRGALQQLAEEIDRRNAMLPPELRPRLAALSRHLRHDMLASALAQQETGRGVNRS
jgi:hypothetical protein